MVNSPCTATYFLGWRYPYCDQSIMIVNVSIPVYCYMLISYIDVGCIDVVMMAIHIARDGFQYDPVVIICMCKAIIDLECNVLAKLIRMHACMTSIFSYYLQHMMFLNRFRLLFPEVLPTIALRSSSPLGSNYTR